MKRPSNLTLKDGKTWFFSRTRNKYWMKGEESGNTQDVMEVLTDCDADTVVIKVKQNGPAACHTGNRSCFYVKWEERAMGGTLEPAIRSRTKSTKKWMSLFRHTRAWAAELLCGVALLRLRGIP